MCTCCCKQPKNLESHRKILRVGMSHIIILRAPPPSISLATGLCARLFKEHQLANAKVHHENNNDDTLHPYKVHAIPFYDNT